jgi:hypothetical protein
MLFEREAVPPQLGRADLSLSTMKQTQSIALSTHTLPAADGTSKLSGNRFGIRINHLEKFRVS